MLFSKIKEKPDILRCYDFLASVVLPLLIFCIPTFSPLLLNIFFRCFYIDFPLITYHDFIKRGVIVLLSISLLFNIIETNSYKKNLNGFFKFLFILLTFCFILGYGISFPAIENLKFSNFEINYKNYELFSYVALVCGVAFYLFNRVTDLSERKVTGILNDEKVSSSATLEAEFDSLRGDR